jgi:hypothetical protein
MRTISQVVEAIIQESPFFAEVISEGVANNAEIARRIKPVVEKRLLEKVSESAIAMALHRMSKTTKKRSVFGAKFLKHISDITVRSNLVEFIFPNSADISRAVEEIFKTARKHPESFVNFSRGLYETLLILNDSLEKSVTRVLRKEKHTRRGGLSAITMRLPQSSLNIPGLYYPLLKAIAWEGISFVEVMSIDTEFSIIFEDKDVDRAFSILKKTVS